MRTLILARHGESDYSARGLCNGDPAIPVGLTERGREQAARLGRELADVDLQLGAASEFPRTQETADIALAGRSIPRLVLPELNDISYGELEDCTREQYHAWQQQHGRHARLPGGESRSDVGHRAGAALNLLLSRDEEVILAVSHELLIEMVLNAVEGRDLTAVRRVEYATPERLTEDAARGAAALLIRH